jgi:hypothetical protein
MKSKMISVVSVMACMLIMIPIVTQAQEKDIVPTIERCPAILNLVTITGKVIELYTPRVLSDKEMEVRFLINDAKSKCNCLGFIFKSNPEEVKAVYTALWTALNDPKLIVTFCCSFGKKSQGAQVTPGVIPAKPEWKEWRDVYTLSFKLE